MEKFHIADIPKTDRITHLVDNLYAKMPVIESARAKLVTESYKETEDEPIITRRAKAFAHILHNIPIIIRDEELIVGSSTLAPRGCQTFPEYSFQWLEDELDTVATRTADPFYISEETKADLREVHKYWKGKTTSELATSYMAPEAILAIDHNIFTPGNYFYNGVGHVTVKYEEGQAIGLSGTVIKIEIELPIMMKKVLPSMGNYLISLFKDTSIASAITVGELTYISKVLTTQTFRVFEVWLTTGILYVAACYLIAFILRRVEKLFL